MSGPLDLYITIDTEVWPTGCSGDPAAVQAAVDRSIFGRTKSGDFGLQYQLDIFGAHGVAVDFFVEALFADAVGIEWLRAIVDPVVAAGQGVQLHIHPEWLAATPDAGAAVAARRGPDIGAYEEDDQAALIARGIANLVAAGAPAPVAFRAGNYGAGPGTLRAVARNGIAFDTSYNPCYLARNCRMNLGTLLQQPAAIDGVTEVPITVYFDRPGHLRHFQLGACSGEELARVIERAFAAGWRTLVLVSHSFEMMNQRRDRPDPIMVRRFERFCRFLADNRDIVRTARFAAAKPAATATTDGAAQVTPVASNVLLTARRHVAQAARRLFG